MAQLERPIFGPSGSESARNRGLQVELESRERERDSYQSKAIQLSKKWKKKSREEDENGRETRKRGGSPELPSISVQTLRHTDRFHERPLSLSQQRRSFHARKPHRQVIAHRSISML